MPYLDLSFIRGMLSLENLRTAQAQCSALVRPTNPCISATFRGLSEARLYGTLCRGSVLLVVLAGTLAKTRHGVGQEKYNDYKDDAGDRENEHPDAEYGFADGRQPMEDVWNVVFRNGRWRGSSNGGCSRVNTCSL